MGDTQGLSQELWGGACLGDAQLGRRVRWAALDHGGRVDTQGLICLQDHGAKPPAPLLPFLILSVKCSCLRSAQARKAPGPSAPKEKALSAFFKGGSDHLTYSVKAFWMAAQSYVLVE